MFSIQACQLNIGKKYATCSNSLKVAQFCGKTMHAVAEINIYILDFIINYITKILLIVYYTHAVHIIKYTYI